MIFQKSKKKNSRSIIIIDYISGWASGGHAEDYLELLIKVTSKFSPVVEAPFYQAQKPIKTGFYSRFSRIFRLFLLIILGMRKKPLALLVFHCPLFWDIVFVALGGIFPGSHGKAVLFLRRDIAWHASGGIIRQTIIYQCLKYLAVAGILEVVSDSKPVLKYWNSKLGLNGKYIPVPIRECNVTLKQSGGNIFSFGLIGMFRIEKGARSYSQIICGLLKAYQNLNIHCQISYNGNIEEIGLAQQISLEYTGNPRVHLYEGHLSRKKYENLLQSLDIVLLPYDVDAYQGGSSGVFGEAIGAGALIVSTRIPWALDEFQEDPAVFWSEDTSAQSMLKSVADCTNYKTTVKNSAKPVVRRNLFAESWCQVLNDTIKI